MLLHYLWNMNVRKLAAIWNMYFDSDVSEGSIVTQVISQVFIQG